MARAAPVNTAPPMKTKTSVINTPPPLERTLSYGDRGDDVRLVQQILNGEGCFTGTPLGNFLDLTLEAVKYFQGTHLGPDGKFLKVDGLVGPRTWWALHNAHGAAQKSNVDTSINTKDVADAAERVAVLEFLRGLHTKGVREVPNGSNYGDGVTAIVNACGFTYGIAWCMALQSYAEREANGAAPLGAMHVSCYQFWNAAMDAGCAYRRGSYTPIPGDVGIYCYGSIKSSGRFYGPGHAIRVARVAANGRAINAYEGNAGNRLKYSVRNLSDSNLVGFVNLYGDAAAPPKFEPGITKAPTLKLTLKESR